MTVVYWTPEALARLEDIEAYITQDAPAVAKDVIARLLAPLASAGSSATQRPAGAGLSPC